MQNQLLALADTARWRIVEALAEQPRSVGVIAELCGLRQPQATKHLQLLERAGLVVSRRTGNRRIYAIETDSLQALAQEVARVAGVAGAHRELRERFDVYAEAVESETRAAGHERWADGREYVLSRVLAGDRRTAWAYLTDPTLLMRWWTTADLRLSRLHFDATPGTPIVQEYVDAHEAHGSAEAVGRAVGVIEKVVEEERIAFQLSPLLADGSPAFTAHYEWALSSASGGTEFEVRIRISDSTVPAAEFIAGIRPGWEQVLDNLAAAVAEAADVVRTPVLNSKEQS